MVLTLEYCIITLDLIATVKDLSLSLDQAIKIIPIIRYIGVVFSLTGSLSLGRYHFYFLMILKEAKVSKPPYLSHEI